MRKFTFLIGLFSFIQLMAQQELVLKKGSLSNNLKVPQYEESLFTIYLPTNFDLSKNWPIIIGFDADHDPSRLTSILRTSGEQMGYIVVVSNYSDKSSLNDKVLYVSDFLSYLNTILPLDQRRLYTVGYNEDAVLSSALPIVFKQIDGVLAIGDSFSYFRSDKIRKNFYFAGIVSNRSHTYIGLRNIRNYLKSKAIPAELYEYKDQVLIPPDSDIITKALTSFEIKNMIKGRIPKDSLWLHNQYHTNLEEVKTLLEKKEYLNAYRELSRMRSTFRYVMDTKALKEKQKLISRISAYRKDKRRFRNYLSQENLWRNVLAIAMQEDLVQYRFKNLGWWKYKIKEIDKLLKSDNEYEVIMAVRLKGYIKALIKSANSQLDGADTSILDHKLFLSVLETVINPEEYIAYKKVISLSAKDGDNQTALFYLEEMLKNGYEDLESLYTIEGTLALKVTAAYNAVIKKHLGTSKYQRFK